MLSPMRSSSRAYAKARDVTDKAIRKQIANGTIIRGTDGLIDVAQADASWHRLHLARRGQASAKMAGGVALATARIEWTRARLAVETYRLEGLKDRYIERDECRRVILAEVAIFLAELRVVPQKYAAWLGDTDKRVARRVLGRLITATIEDIGDLPAAALDVIGRA
jgi:hypothetical protein